MLHAQEEITQSDETELLKRRYERERRARQQAEAVLEANSLDLYQKHQELLRLNARLEDRVSERTAALAEAVAQARQASAAKGEFLARMSHEIRTPMNGVMGMLEALLATQVNPEQAEFLHTAYVSAETLLRLIDDILDYSKIEAGKLAIESTHFDLAALLERIVQLWSVRAADKGVALTYTLAGEPPHWFRGDPLRIGQILNNLVSNAIKFTQRGTVRVAIAVERGENATAKIHFLVEDTGVGMTAEAVSQLFAPFMQADGSTSRRFGGTGLGLAICRQLVGLMGGAPIRVASAPGAGARFEFDLELQTAEVPPHLETAPHPAMSAVAASACGTVLIVDDNPTNRRVVELILKRMGIKHRSLESGRAAVEAIASHEYALVLMDCHMPEVDGFEATAQIRRWEQACARSRLPIVAVSASAFKEDRERCAAAGMDDFLPKPVTAASMATVLAKWVRPDESASSSRHVNAELQPTSPGAAPRAVPPTAPDAELFDEAQLAELRSLAGEEFPQVVADFAAQATRALENLSRAVAEHDSDLLRRAAHRFKGTAATFGAVRLTELALMLERLGKVGGVLDAAPGIRQLKTGWEAVYARLSARLHERGNDE